MSKRSGPASPHRMRLSKNVLSLASTRGISIRSLSSVPKDPDTKSKRGKGDKKGAGNSGLNERKADVDRDKKLTENLLQFVEAVRKTMKNKIEFPPEVAEEHFRIGREYSRQLRIRDNLERKDIATKIWLQQEAMRALPPDLRAKAEIIDEEPPPRGRPWPVWQTPPIKDFDLKKYSSTEEAQEGEEQ